LLTLLHTGLGLIENVRLFDEIHDKSRQLAEASEPGKGSVFTVRLPCGEATLN
jgi:signal transduction histidine kinase